MVIGLGAFGECLCRSLQAAEFDVLAVDPNKERIETLTDVVSSAIHADIADERVVERLPFGDADHVVIAVDDDFLVSVLAALQAKHSGAPDIWATAIDAKHSRVLELVGVDHVIDAGVAASERIVTQLLAADTS